MYTVIPIEIDLYFHNIENHHKSLTQVAIFILYLFYLLQNCKSNLHWLELVYLDLHSIHIDGDGGGVTETEVADALVTDGGTKTQFSSHSKMYEIQSGHVFFRTFKQSSNNGAHTMKLQTRNSARQPIP